MDVYYNDMQQAERTLYRIQYTPFTISAYTHTIQLLLSIRSIGAVLLHGNICHSAFSFIKSCHTIISVYCILTVSMLSASCLQIPHGRLYKGRVYIRVFTQYIQQISFKQLTWFSRHSCLNFFKDYFFQADMQSRSEYSRKANQTLQNLSSTTDVINVEVKIKKKTKNVKKRGEN